MPPPDFRPIVPRTIKLIDTRTLYGRLQKKLQDLALDMQSDVQKYPPSQSSYRRTGNLGRRWTISGPNRRGNDLVVRVGNNASYAGFVEGYKSKAPFQRALFAGYDWPSSEDVLKKRIAEYRPKFQEELKKKG